MLSSDTYFMTRSGCNNLIISSIFVSINNRYQFEVIWDSGASICITPHKSDFVSYDNRVEVRKVAGVSGNNANIVG